MPAVNPVSGFVVLPVLHRYVNVPEVPPVPAANICPSFPPRQFASVGVIVTPNAAGFVRITVSESSQPVSSVAVTVYIPAGRFVMVAVAAPLLHAKVKVPPLPPVAEAAMIPVESPEQGRLSDNGVNINLCWFLNRKIHGISTTIVISSDNPNKYLPLSWWPMRPYLCLTKCN